MPNPALLHQNQLEGFKSWLTSKGREWRETTAAYQVIQIKHGSGWQAIFKRNNAPEHLSVPQPLVQLVRTYIRESRLTEVVNGRL